VERAAVEAAELMALRLRAALATYIPAAAPPIGATTLPAV
jgi:hypothetical protein